MDINSLLNRYNTGTVIHASDISDDEDDHPDPEERSVRDLISLFERKINNITDEVEADQDWWDHRSKPQQRKQKPGRRKEKEKIDVDDSPTLSPLPPATPEPNTPLPEVEANSPSPRTPVKKEKKKKQSQLEEIEIQIRGTNETPIVVEEKKKDKKKDKKKSQAAELKVGVVGSRTFTDYKRLRKVLNQIHKTTPITHIVSGGAKGADLLAEKWARKKGVEKIIYLPDWEEHGKKAGILRNKKIVETADRLVVFWDGESKGASNSIKRAKKMGKPCDVHRFEEEE